MMLVVVALVGSATRLLAKSKEAPHRLPGLLVQELVFHLSDGRAAEKASRPGEIMMTSFLTSKGRLYRVLLVYEDGAPEGYYPRVTITFLGSKDLLVRLGRSVLPTEKSALLSLPQADWSEVGALVEQAPVEDLVLITRYWEGRRETVITLKDKLPPPLASLHGLMIAKARERIDAPGAAKE